MICKYWVGYLPIVGNYWLNIFEHDMKVPRWFECILGKKNIFAGGRFFDKKIKILTVLGQLRYFQVLPGTLKLRFLGQLITRLKQNLGHLSSRFGHFRGFFERMLTVPTVFILYFRKNEN